MLYDEPTPIEVVAGPPARRAGEGRGLGRGRDRGPRRGRGGGRARGARRPRARALDLRDHRPHPPAVSAPAPGWLAALASLPALAEARRRLAASGRVGPLRPRGPRPRPRAPPPRRGAPPGRGAPRARRGRDGPGPADARRRGRPPRGRARAPGAGAAAVPRAATPRRRLRAPGRGAPPGARRPRGGRLPGEPPPAEPRPPPARDPRGEPARRRRDDARDPARGARGGRLRAGGPGHRARPGGAPRRHPRRLPLGQRGAGAPRVLRRHRGEPPALRPRHAARDRPRWTRSSPCPSPTCSPPAPCSPRCPPSSRRGSPGAASSPRSWSRSNAACRRRASSSSWPSCPGPPCRPGRTSRRGRSRCIEPEAVRQEARDFWARAVEDQQRRGEGLTPEPAEALVSLADLEARLCAAPARRGAGGGHERRRPRALRLPPRAHLRGRRPPPRRRPPAAPRGRRWCSSATRAGRTA